MLAPCKKTLKKCLKPIYHRLPGPVLRAVEHWRSRRAARISAAAAPILPAVTAGGSVPTEMLLQHLEESDRLLLAALKMTQSSGATSSPPGFQAVNLGNDRLLAVHPRYPFVYLDARDLRQTPHIVAGCYEPGVQRALERWVRPGACVVEVGAGQGYHTLSLASLVGPTGQVFALEPEANAFSVLHDNLTAHQLASTVTAMPGGSGTLRELLGVRHPDFIRIDARTRLAEVMGELRAALERDSRIPVMTTFQSRWGNEFLVRLCGSGRRLWRLDPEGGTREVTPQGLLEGSTHERVDILAASELD